MARRSTRLQGMVLASALAGATALGPSIADAAPKKPNAAAKTKSKPAPKSKDRQAGPKSKDTPKGKEGPTEEAAAITPGAKVAVFPFSGDDVEPVRRQVLHLLKAKGLKANTSLRPFDSPEQYRETAVALGLVAYVDGEVTVDGAEASATIFVRSGATGLRIASATFAGERRQVPADLGKGLWDQVSAPLGRACADAAKPRKPDREPMRINAGTPIADNPPDGD